jgi:hypothetical protein
LFLHVYLRDGFRKAPHWSGAYVLLPPMAEGNQ